MTGIFIVLAVLLGIAAGVWFWFAGQKKKGPRPSGMDPDHPTRAPRDRTG